MDIVASTPKQLTLPKQSCFVVPGVESEHVQLKIENSVHGYYSISGEAGRGYAWGAPADGIYYCVKGGESLAFEDYVDGSTVIITAEPAASDSDCISDIISYDGNIPLEIPEWGTSTEVYWSHHRYFLHASHFEYQVKGEMPVTMQDAEGIEIGGDPGDHFYTSIEILWNMGGNQKRFLAYIDADEESWRINEIRVYDNTEDWASFFSRRPFGTPLLSGARETCFHKDTLVLSNEDGSKIRFQNLTLVTFLPWTDEAAFLGCFDGKDAPSAESVAEREESGESSFDPPTENTVAEQEESGEPSLDAYYASSPSCAPTSTDLRKRCALLLNVCLALAPLMIAALK